MKYKGNYLFFIFLTSLYLLMVYSSGYGLIYVAARYCSMHLPLFGYIIFIPLFTVLCVHCAWFITKKLAQERDVVNLCSK
ncbi:hypothetical protein [Paenibacillus xylanexedens]|uniref:hypothetical protein n=1 Tax=Paenibacillus xylanexedens TaxID=528191 RepID=UPI0011A81C88|nr:hypothetical protein [Paenibacillus xylanexedens]